MLIKEIRSTLGKTQVEFASLIGVGQSAVANWEAGNGRVPHHSYALKIVEEARKAGLKVSLEQIYQQ